MIHTQARLVDLPNSDWSADKNIRNPAFKTAYPPSCQMETRNMIQSTIDKFFIDDADQLAGSETDPLSAVECL